MLGRKHSQTQCTFGGRCPGGGRSTPSTVQSHPIVRRPSQCLSQALHPLSNQTSDAASSAAAFRCLGCEKVFQNAHTSRHMAVMLDQLAQEAQEQTALPLLVPILWRECFLQLYSGDCQNVHSYMWLNALNPYNGVLDSCQQGMRKLCMSIRTVIPRVQ